MVDAVNAILVVMFSSQLPKVALYSAGFRYRVGVLPAGNTRTKAATGTTPHTADHGHPGGGLPLFHYWVQRCQETAL